MHNGVTGRRGKSGSVHSSDERPDASTSCQTPDHRSRKSSVEVQAAVSKYHRQKADKHRFAFHGFGGWKSEISPWQGISTGTVPGESLLPSS